MGLSDVDRELRDMFALIEQKEAEQTDDADEDEGLSDVDLELREMFAAMAEAEQAEETEDSDATAGAAPVADATPQPGDEQAGEAAPAAVAQPDQQPDTQEITEPDVAEQSDAGLNEAGADLMPSGSTLEAQTDIVDDDAQATPAEGRMALFNDQEPVPQKISTEDYISGKVNLLRTYLLR